LPTGEIQIVSSQRKVSWVGVAAEMTRAVYQSEHHGIIDKTFPFHLEGLGFIAGAVTGKGAEID
jgi:hypothetical protein